MVAQSMNEERLSLYLNLIEQLLNCTSEAELQQCLTDNQELVDRELMLVMKQVAAMFEQNEEQEPANYLNSLATFLEYGLGILEDEIGKRLTVNPEDYFNFLTQVLQTIQDSDSNPEVVYPLLQKNLDKLNESFQWAIITLPTLELKRACEVARVIGKFSNLINESPSGSKARNLEIAIKGYQAVVSVLTPDTVPYEWATTQNNLGTAYSDRIKGDKADNLEDAITCYREALKVHTPDAFPYEWARTQNNLGVAYSDRVKGDKADNLEDAIACYQEALKVYTPNAFPYRWATTQNNLGVAYSDRIKGDKANNLEDAITCYREALKVYTPNAFTYEWAMTHNNLGLAYGKRIKGDKADNLEDAIACYREALKVHTPGNFSYKWAATQNNLGLAYEKRIKEEKADNLEDAIACYREALKVYTSNAFPYEWAATQNNLGLAYGKRIKGEKADNLEDAIACYREALKVYTSNAFPLQCLRTERNLGNLAFGEENWQLAIEAYKGAIEAVEFSRSWAMTPQSKQEVMEAAIDVYYNVVQASVNAEQIPLALEYVERGKTRNLVELLATRDLKPKGNFSPAIVEKLDRLRHEILTEQIYLANQERTYYSALSRLGHPSQPSRPDRTRLNELQQELDELIERDISPIDPTFSLTQKVEPIPFSDIQSLIDKHTAIVEWYITGEKILTFLVTHHSSHPQVWQSSTEALKALQKRMNTYLRLYYRGDDKKWWRKQLESRLQNLAEILHLNEILSNVPPECDRLILIPHRFLHILPLHALPVSPQQLGRRAGGEGKYLLDLFPRGVQYAPSCQLLKLAQSQQRPDFHNLFAIQNPTIPDPTKQLLFTDLEVETIRSFFPHPEVLAKSAATEDAVKKYPNFSSVHCAHFSCHGEFNPKSPLESALILANEEHWTLGEIFELFLPQCRLVTLSACETGVTDFNSLSDEYIGLPNGFLFAGSPSVLSSLWTVDELSTTLLMIKFYENLRQFPQRQAGDVAVALQTAQQWLRDLTIEQLDTFLEQYKPQVEKTLAQWRKGQRLRFEKSLEFIRQRQPQPFVNPYYWAAFIAIGF